MKNLRLIFMWGPIGLAILVAILAALGHGSSLLFWALLAAFMVAVVNGVVDMMMSTQPGVFEALCCVAMVPATGIFISVNFEGTPARALHVLACRIIGASWEDVNWLYASAIVMAAYCAAVWMYRRVVIVSTER